MIFFLRSTKIYIEWRIEESSASLLLTPRIVSRLPSLLKELKIRDKDLISNLVDHAVGMVAKEAWEGETKKSRTYGKMKSKPMAKPNLLAVFTEGLSECRVEFQCEEHAGLLFLQQLESEELMQKLSIESLILTLDAVQCFSGSEKIIVPQIFEALLERAEEVATVAWEKTRMALPVVCKNLSLSENKSEGGRLHQKLAEQYLSRIRSAKDLGEVENLIQDMRYFSDVDCIYD